MSPLIQGRGLKRHVAMDARALRTVAPHTGAWIETQTIALNKMIFRRPSYRGVD